MCWSLVYRWIKEAAEKLEEYKINDDIKEIDEDINCNIPDIVMNGEIDLGDIAIEHLALILDDHPRKDGEEFSSIIEDVTPVKNNPFASLAKLKK